MTAATVYNLSELATVLSADGQHPDLVEAIERAAAVSSAHRDLREALLGLNLLRRLTHAGDETPLSDDDMTTIVGSLMTNAIILYARATDTKPIARRKWFGEGKLPTDLRAVHRELMQLRDKEIAHFGKGEPVDGAPLLEEALVLRPSDRDHQLGFLSSRMHNRAALARRAEYLVEMVLALCEETVSKRHTDIHRLLSKLAEAKDPVMAKLGTMPLSNPRLLAAEASSQRNPAPCESVGNFSGTAVVEIHDGDLAAR